MLSPSLFNVNMSNIKVGTQNYMMNIVWSILGGGAGLAPPARSITAVVGVGYW